MKKKTAAQFISQAQAIHGDKYDYSRVVYEATDREVELVCRMHGSFFTTPKVHLRVRKSGSTSGCKECLKDSRRISVAEFIERSNIHHKYFYDYSLVEFTKVTDSVIIGCPTHGNFAQNVNAHMRSGYGCKECSTSNSKHDFDQFISKAECKHGDRYEYIHNSYVSSTHPVDVVCSTHGTFSQIASNHLIGHGCPKCASSISKPEKEIVDFIRSLNVDVVQSDRSIIKPKELDIVIPSHNLAIEFNGTYWHSSFLDRIPPSYHQHKTDLCESAGYNLMHVYEHDYINRKPLISSMIRHKLGKSERIYARNCTIVELSTKEARDFANLNHLQGHVNSSIYVGLTYNDSLCMMMSFASARFNNSETWELMRMCSSMNVAVVGGASKILSHFTSKNPGSVMTYASRDHSSGSVYKQLGFEYTGSTKPGYLYVKRGEVLSRYSCMKHKLAKLLGSDFDPSKTESENMQASGYHKIFNAGNLKFTLTNLEK